LAENSKSRSNLNHLFQSSSFLVASSHRCLHYILLLLPIIAAGVSSSFVVI
jgi:hypothetical protein